MVTPSLEASDRMQPWWHIDFALLGLELRESTDTQCVSPCCGTIGRGHREAVQAYCPSSSSSPSSAPLVSSEDD